MFVTVCILPIVGLYSEADEYDTLQSYFCKVHFNIILPSTSRSLSCRSSICLFPSKYSIERPSYYLCFYSPKLMEAFIIKLHQNFCYFLRLSSKYSPERANLETPPLMLFSCDPLRILLFRIRPSLGAVFSTAVRTCPEVDQPPSKSVAALFPCSTAAGAWR